MTLRERAALVMLSVLTKDFELTHTRLILGDDEVEDTPDRWEFRGMDLVLKKHLVNEAFEWARIIEQRAAQTIPLDTEHEK